MEKLIITAAICGAEVTKEQNPNVPYTVDEIVREAKSAYDERQFDGNWYLIDYYPLKPCPFCGSEAKMEESYNHRVYASCLNDRCTCYLQQLYETPAELAERWNTRKG